MRCQPSFSQTHQKICFWQEEVAAEAAPTDHGQAEEVKQEPEDEEQEQEGLRSANGRQSRRGRPAKQVGLLLSLDALQHGAVAGVHPYSASTLCRQLPCTCFLPD